MRTAAATFSTFSPPRSEEHTSELQSRFDLVCRLLLEKKKNNNIHTPIAQHLNHPDSVIANISVLGNDCDRQSPSWLLYLRLSPLTFAQSIQCPRLSTQ